MFDVGIGFSELMLLAVIVIIVVGPEELPSLLRTVGRYISQVKRIADDFRSQVDEAIKEPMEEIQETIEGVSENLDDDPFGEEDLIDFEEHNQKILDDEADEFKDETATEKALREGGVSGIEPKKKKKKKKKKQTKNDDQQGDPTPKDQEGHVQPDGDVALAKKSGT